MGFQPKKRSDFYVFGIRRRCFFFAAFAYLVQLGSTWFNLVLGRFQPFPAGFEFQDTDGELTPMELGGVVQLG